MQPGDWQQAVITFPGRAIAEETAAGSLLTALDAAQASGAITGWFFTRKFPCWRLRCRLGGESTTWQLGHMLDGLTAEGRITGWASGIYEPETVAFGGPAAMDIAHDLFCADSSHVLAYLGRQQAAAPGQPWAGRREIAILLAGHLMRGAMQDWYEQADVWAKVASCRPAVRDVAAQDGPRDGSRAVRTLMTTDAGPRSSLAAREPSGLIGAWSETFELAGGQLAELARHGKLERGLRAVLAHQLIFAFNRLGLPATDQGTLAALAAEAVMGGPDDGAPPLAAGAVPAKFVGMDTETTTPDAGSLRQDLVGQLLDRAVVRSSPVEQALRAVPRHLFVPAVPIQQAYADEPVYTKHDAAGAPVSAASQPTIVAMMLEQLQARPGQRILEIGAGTGYNAGLLAFLTGEDGQVTTIDVDQDLTDGARKALASAGYPDVRVILGDGALGYPAGAPYDRIIATVGVWDLPPAWLAQLAPDGRLLIPLRLRGSVTRSLAFERDDGHWNAVSSQMCGFMPLRASIAGDPRRIIPLTADSAVTLHAYQDQDVNPDALGGVLTRPRSQELTGVTFGNQESVEWMDLWLACTLANAVSRMPVQRQAVDAGLVTPMFRWGAMATAENDTLAYLTFRPAPPAADGTARSEVGVIAHGSHAADLAARVADQVRTWDRVHRTRTPRIQVQPASAPEPVTGQFTFATPNNQLAISWD